jgi:predicted transcriptional regulator
MIVMDVLPIVRKELALELIDAHKIKKAAVARMFDVSGTAISQYVHGSRGNRTILEGSPRYDEFVNEIKISAQRLAEKSSRVLDELCRLCDLAKRIGVVDTACEAVGERTPLPKCLECPMDGFDGKS